MPYCELKWEIPTSMKLAGFFLDNEAELDAMLTESIDEAVKDA